MELGPLAGTIANDKYYWAERGETCWRDVAKRVVPTVMGAAPKESRNTAALTEAMAQRQWMPGGRYCYATGRPFHQTQNCVLLRAHDSREGWAGLLHKSAMALMTGAGVGVNYSPVREEGAIIKKTGGLATGPIALMQMLNEAGRGIMQGGARRSAIWAGLKWDYPDIFKFIKIKNWSPEVKALKAKDFSFPATLDHTNISVCLNDEFFRAFYNKHHAKHALANAVFWATVEQMLETGEPGFSIDVGDHTGEDLRNACTEVTSRDSDDICNLGSINMGRVKTLDEFKRLVEWATEFLLAGTLYSDVPYHDIAVIRDKNRRLGLGLMGIHEWLLQRGYRYGMVDELAEWMGYFENISDLTAERLAEAWGISCPLGKRAIAPNGTIGIVAETTTGCEPIFCVAYKRRYLKSGSQWVHQYVVDPVAKRLIEQGVNPKAIEDAYSLAGDVERRIKFQADLQAYVDHGISSTINLPHWGSELNNSNLVQSFGQTLLKYLPKLRGVTVYPDGARGGQPLTPVSYQTAIKHEGAELVEETVNLCDITKGGSCGD